jgi:hypothetical protein
MNSVETSAASRILKSRKFHVFAAMGVPVILGVFLAVRMAASNTPAPPPTVFDARIAAEPPAASVPAPRPFDEKKLEFPSWTGKESKDRPVRFQTDLDLLAPLGTGQANAALWLKDFSKAAGSRAQEAESAMKRCLPAAGTFTKVLPPDDPLLREAGPWCDMASMKFYPDIYPIAGLETYLPNLLLAVSLGQSWAARGTAASDSGAAMEDFRRAIRWGRLLRQDDVTVITDLIGLACIQRGAQGIYDRALRDGDTRLALLASVVLSEVAPQRLMTSNRMDKVSISSCIGKGLLGGMKLTVPDERVEEIATFAADTSDRRFLFEALGSMNIIRFSGTSAQRAIVDKAFEKLLASKDPITLAMARQSYEKAPTDQDLKLYGQMK